MLYLGIRKINNKVMNKENKILEMGEIAKLAPSIFNESPSDNVSKHYVHIPTSKVIEDMKELGWGVIDVKEVKARKNVGFQKHLVIFRHPNIVIKGEDEIFPQILLTNSHDGKNAFTFTVGLFRLICSNGLVICDTKFGDIKLRHMGYEFEVLQTKIKEILEMLPLTIESVNKMMQVEMDEKTSIEFAKRAIECRFNEKERERIKVNYMDLIQPVRKEDDVNNLWGVFNIIQEKLITGDFNYNMGVKIRKARMVKNFNQDLKINKDLFSLALEYSN
jgi:hypothetical protein